MSYISEGDLLFSNVNKTKYIATGPEFVKRVQGVAKQFVPVVNPETGATFNARLGSVVKFTL